MVFFLKKIFLGAFFPKIANFSVLRPPFLMTVLKIVTIFEKKKIIFLLHNMSEKMEPNFIGFLVIFEL